MSTPTQADLAYAAYLLKKEELVEALDGFNPDSRPSKKQRIVFEGLGKYRHRYVRAGNQAGKSAVGRRESTWVFLENHPFWTRPEHWGDEPLTMLILGQDRKQMDESLWKGMKALLPEGSYKEIKDAVGIVKVVNKHNGNTIVFISHDNANEAAKRAQSYPAHWVWLDEMPSSYKLVEELHRRIQTKKGFFLFTMTPKVVNMEIRKLVDAAKPPLAQLYRMHVFDNPIYEDDPELRQEVLDSIATYSEAYQATILEGEWSLGEEMVYYYDPEVMRVDLDNYHPSWRHVLGVDPALKSKLGYTLWAEHPDSGKWYNVRADYIKDIYDPTECVKAVEEKVKGFNIVRRISDTNPWYVGAAASLGYKYMSVYKKANRKAELIKGFQGSLGKNMFLTQWSGQLESELTSCRWSNKAAEKIVNSSSYHIIDTCQYVSEVFPKFVPHQKPQDWQARVEMANEKRQMKKEKAKRRRIRQARSMF